MRFLYIVSLFIIVCTSCNTTKKSVSAVSSEEAGLLISMKKTACYGTCPVYEIQIYGDLNVILNGERYLDKVGRFRSTIKTDRLEELRSMFHEADFFSFEDKYSENITDLPTTYVYFNDSGMEKRVMDYYGAPESLKVIEDNIASLLNELEWIKIEEE